MRDAIISIEEYTSDMDYNKYIATPIVKDAVEKQLIVLTEAATHLSEECLGEMSHIDWKGIKGLRIVLVHGYFKVDSMTVWNIIKNELADLKIQTEKLLKGKYRGN